MTPTIEQQLRATVYRQGQIIIQQNKRIQQLTKENEKPKQIKSALNSVLSLSHSAPRPRH